MGGTHKVTDVVPVKMTLAVDIFSYDADFFFSPSTNIFSQVFLGCHVRSIDCVEHALTTTRVDVSRRYSHPCQSYKEMANYHNG